MPASAPSEVWPDLPYPAWKETGEALHLWVQIAGKIRLALTPWLNHSWHVPFYLTARGLSTSPIPYRDRSFEIVFDFIEEVVAIVISDGARRDIPLRAGTTAALHAAVMARLAELGIAVAISDLPSEIAGATPFSRDHAHRAYDGDQARRFWRLLLQADRVLKLFRTGFVGKASPVHFFWGSFDLAVTRFSGRRAPPHPGGVPGLKDAVLRDAYSHEVSSAGFWPGGGGVDYAAFYSYAYPEPEGFRSWPAQPEAAFFSERLGEFLLPYSAVRQAADPDTMLLAFLQSTYEAAAVTGHWDRANLECALGAPGVPRSVS